MIKLYSVAAALVFLMPCSALAQKVYKCTVSGKQVFQDSPCSPDAASSSVIHVVPNNFGNSARSYSSQVEELRALKEEMARLGGPGATSAQVTLKMGKPSEIRTKIVDGEILEEWTYANGSIVKFKSGRVVSTETVRRISQ